MTGSQSLCKPPLPLSIFSTSATVRLKPLRSTVQMAASSSDPSAVGPSASSAVDLLTLCHSLKKTKRAGWVLRGVREPESVADHMYRMGVMALVAPAIPGVDRDRCIKMALVHDIAEAIVGDITPSDGVPKEEKSRRESEALDHMCKVLGGGSTVIIYNHLSSAQAIAKSISSFLTLLDLGSLLRSKLTVVQLGMISKRIK